MKTFQENLAGFPGIEGVTRIELVNGDNNVASIIENKAGSQGSLRLYLHLINKHGAITPAAAQEGLDLYAEHTADARNHPGKHPNIDRLMDLINSGATLSARVVSE